MWLPAAVLLGLGCGGSGERVGTPVAEEVREVGGIYRVSGTTVEQVTGISRGVTGLLVVRDHGQHYTANFELKTEYRHDGKGDGMSAELIGEGTGKIEGDTLRGTATTQFVLAMIPGIDAQFAFLPRQVGPRIASDTFAELGRDRGIAIEIESRPESGERYRPTKTTLVGTRVGDVGSAPTLPDVAAPAP